MEDNGMCMCIHQLPPICGVNAWYSLLSGGGGELEIGLLIELVRPDVPIGRGRGRSCEVGRGGG